MDRVDPKLSRVLVIFHFMLVIVAIVGFYYGATVGFTPILWMLYWGGVMLGIYSMIPWEDDEEAGGSDPVLALEQGRK